MTLDKEVVRFCQQCGRFQSLDEFDGSRRSCRKKLQMHNAQRKRVRERMQRHQQPAVSPSKSPSGPPLCTLSKSSPTAEINKGRKNIESDSGASIFTALPRNGSCDPSRNNHCADGPPPLVPQSLPKLTAGNLLGGAEIIDDDMEAMEIDDLLLSFNLPASQTAKMSEVWAPVDSANGAEFGSDSAFSSLPPIVDFPTIDMDVGSTSVPPHALKPRSLPLPAAANVPSAPQAIFVPTAPRHPAVQASPFSTGPATWAFANSGPPLPSHIPAAAPAALPTSSWSVPISEQQLYQASYCLFKVPFSALTHLLQRSLVSKLQQQMYRRISANNPTLSAAVSAGCPSLNVESLLN